MEKGQLIGQPLVFLFYLIAASLILFVGIKAVTSLNCYNDKIEYYDFIRRFESRISTINNDAVGSRLSLKELNLPSKFDYICFFEDSQNLDLVENYKLRLLIETSMNQNDPPNMFVYSSDACSDFEVMVEKIKDLNIGENFCDSLTDRSFNAVLESIPGEVNISKSI